MTFKDELLHEAGTEQRASSGLLSLEIVVSPARFQEIYGLAGYDELYASLEITHSPDSDLLQTLRFRDLPAFACVRQSEWESMLELLQEGQPAPTFSEVLAVFVPAYAWRFGRIPRHENDLIVVQEPLGRVIFGHVIEKQADLYKYKAPTTPPTTKEGTESLYSRGVVPRGASSVLDLYLEMDENALRYTAPGEKHPALSVERDYIGLDRPAQVVRRLGIQSKEGLVTNELSKILPSTMLFPTKPLVPSLQAGLGPLGLLGLIVAQY